MNNYEDHKVDTLATYLQKHFSGEASAKPVKSVVPTRLAYRIEQFEKNPELSGMGLLSADFSALRSKISKIELESDKEETLAVLNALADRNWDVRISAMIKDKLMHNAPDPRNFTNEFDFLVSVSLLENAARNEDLISEEKSNQISDRIFNACYDIFYINPSDIRNSRQISFYKKWEILNTPGFCERTLKHPNIWRVCTDPAYAEGVMGKHNVAVYDKVWKHTKINNKNMLDYWVETTNLMGRHVYNKAGFEPNTTHTAINRVRMIWFKQALRSGITMDDIRKMPVEACNLMLQSAAYTYAKDMHGLVGNFLKTKIPMLRESIDMGLIDVNNYKTITLQLIDDKIENIDLPEMGSEFTI